MLGPWSSCWWHPQRYFESGRLPQLAQAKKHILARVKSKSIDINWSMCVGLAFAWGGDLAGVLYGFPSNVGRGWACPLSASPRGAQLSLHRGWWCGVACFAWLGICLGIDLRNGASYSTHEVTSQHAPIGQGFTVSDLDLVLREEQLALHVINIWSISPDLMQRIRSTMMSA